MKVRIVWLILCCIWGSTWLFIKIGLNDLPPFTFAGFRFVLASLILGSLVLLRRVRWPRTRDEWSLIAVSGVLQSTFPLFGLVIAHFYLPHERITTVKVTGVLLGIVGVAIIFSDQLSIA